MEHSINFLLYYSDSNEVKNCELAGNTREAYSVHLHLDCLETEYGGLKEAGRVFSHGHLQK